MPELLGAAWKIVNRGDDYIKMLQDETTLGGLSLLLSSEQEGTLLEALDLLLCLAKKPYGPEYLVKFAPLKEAITVLKDSKEEQRPAIAKAVKELYEIVFLPKRPFIKQTQKAQRTKHGKTRCHVVQLEGNITMSDLKEIETEIVHTRGVVSVTFQLGTCRLVVMAKERLTSEAIFQKVYGTLNMLQERDGQKLSARILKRRKSTASRLSSHAPQDADGKSTVDVSKQPMGPPSAPKPLLPYLEDGADVFELAKDKHGGGVVPKDSEALRQDGNGRGIKGWFVGLFGKTPFW